MISDLFKRYRCEISSKNGIYNIKCPKEDLDVSFKWDTKLDLGLVLKLDIGKFISVITNGIKLDRETTYNNELITDFINAHFIKMSPDAKLNSILEYVNGLTQYDGQAKIIQSPSMINLAKMYFSTEAEWRFYLRSAVEQGYINRRVLSPSDGTSPQTEYNLTVSGLSRIIKINEGKDSQQCFVAMAFTTEMDKIYYEAIQPALTECGFKAYRVSEDNQKSDQTINDAILIGIKKSRFTIADFTLHRNGVYFEAGYALGRGQKVIYSCKDDQMTNAHFDTRNYQHILWVDAKDFKEKLINRIEAFIKD